LTAVPEGWAGQTDLHPDCLEALLDAARLCETLGHTLEEVPPPQLAWPDFSRAYSGLFTSLVGYLKKYWERELGKEITRDELEPLTGLFCEAGMKKTGSDYL
jgi:Asp-tRNA(Asn)/Glu-tRNA(Gln) amidotransferase A subunit family amidase